MITNYDYNVEKMQSFFKARKCQTREKYGGELPITPVPISYATALSNGSLQPVVRSADISALSLATKATSESCQSRRRASFLIN